MLDTLFIIDVMTAQGIYTETIPTTYALCVEQVDSLLVLLQEVQEGIEGWRVRCLEVGI